MYYSNSDAKTELENWYQTNIINKGYSNTVITGNYFCEQAKVTFNSCFVTNSGTSMTVYDSYTPDFKCSPDKNEYGLLNASIGLITYDEVSHAGGYFNITNDKYYIYNNQFNWTMSPVGFSSTEANEWYVDPDGYIYSSGVHNYAGLRPVINLKETTIVTGSGTKLSPYKAQ